MRNDEANNGSAKMSRGRKGEIKRRMDQVEENRRNLEGRREKIAKAKKFRVARKARRKGQS